MDYGSGPYTAMILAGSSTSVMLEVKIKNDNILEGNEAFNITINATSLPDCIDRGDPYQAMVIIIDDDGNLFLYVHACING